VFDFRKKIGEEASLPEELSLKEMYKYDLYSRFDAIALNEPAEITLEVGDE
jgi:hypothetical protein